MKIALLNDTHCGVRNSSQIFIDYQERFYEQVFFPYCAEHDIKKIIHLGDYYDHRKFVNFKALHANRRHFLEPMKQNGMTMDIIPGNHDVFHKNTNDLCSLKELLGYYTSNINIIMKPTTVNYDGLDVHLMPWINPENHQHSMEFIRKNNGILMAHLELADFEMMRGIKQPKGNGMGVEPFKHYDLCLSGHYHASSQQGNIRYLGCQMEFTWADAGDAKYFHVLDTDTQEITAVLNPLTLFEKIYYDDSNTDYSKVDAGYYKSKIVKLIVENKENLPQFEDFVDRLYKSDLTDLTILEELSEYTMRYNEDDEADVEVGNTSAFLEEYVDGMKVEEEKPKIKKLLQVIYDEALNVDTTE